MWLSAQRRVCHVPFYAGKLFARDDRILSVFPPVEVEEQQLERQENMKNTNQSSIALRTRGSAGSQTVNHNESVAVKTGIKSGAGAHASGGGQGAG
jgi:hypothetical protein